MPNARTRAAAAVSPIEVEATTDAIPQSAPEVSRLPKPVVYEGQLDAAAMRTILMSRRDAAAEARQAYLDAHPDFTACSVAGCAGLVGKDYQKVVNGVAWNLCPRRSAHAKLHPTLFATPRAASR